MCTHVFWLVAVGGYIIYYTVPVVVYWSLMMASCRMVTSHCVTTKQYLWPLSLWLCVYMSAMAVCLSFLLATYHVDKSLLH